MATVRVTENSKFTARALQKLQNLTGTNWLSFLDAVGRIESDSAYNAKPTGTHYGIYQQNDELLNYTNFYKSFGQILGVNTIEQFQSNPIAQEVAALMEFGGIPSKYVGQNFSSKYTATMKALEGKLTQEQINQLNGQTFTIIWDGDANSAQTFTINDASISGAAHLEE
ncbi:hypothetical protein [Sulfurospirillum cavolei]|uniref:hypothetical protein n=1 Tax=Sulfurospirillum cavolei TaxID=366522 RepID=UPI003FA1B6F5